MWYYSVVAGVGVVDVVVDMCGCIEHNVCGAVVYGVVASVLYVDGAGVGVDWCSWLVLLLAMTMVMTVIVVMFMLVMWMCGFAVYIGNHCVCVAGSEGAGVVCIACVGDVDVVDGVGGCGVVYGCVVGHSVLYVGAGSVWVGGTGIGDDIDMWIVVGVVVVGYVVSDVVGG